MEVGAYFEPGADAILIIGPDVAVIGIEAPGDQVMQTAGGDMKDKKQEQHTGPETAVPEEGQLYDDIASRRTIQDEQEYVQGR